MKQYEVRTKDLKTVILIPRNQDTIREDPKQWFQWVFSMASGVVLVEHEFETPAEADTARLDYLDSLRSGKMIRICTKEISGHSFREYLDMFRQAPQPTVRVIATPEGPVDPT